MVILPVIAGLFDMSYLTPVLLLGFVFGRCYNHKQIKQALSEIAEQLKKDRDILDQSIKKVKHYLCLLRKNRGP